MSNSKIPLKLCVERDQMSNVSNLDHRSFSVVQNASNVNYQQIIAPNVSNSQIALTVISPSESTAIDTNVYANVVYTVTLVGTTVSGNLLKLGSVDTIKPYPLSNSTSTTGLVINGSSVSYQTADFWDALNTYNVVDDEKQLNDAGTPNQREGCYQYSDLFGTNRSPCALYGDNVLRDPNASFPGITIISNTPTSAVFTVEVYERVCTPLLNMTNKTALVGIQNMNFNFVFRQPLINYIYGHDAVNGSTITSAVANIQAFSLWFRFLTLPILTKIPSECIYRYLSIVPNSQQVSTLAPGASATSTLSALNLQSIPSKLFLYVKQNTSYDSYLLPYSYMEILNVSIVYLNKPGILASASQLDLYNISKKNGYSGSYYDWKKGGQSVLCLKFGDDIGLSANEAPSLAISNQITVTVTYRNNSDHAVTANLWNQFLFDGSCVISQGMVNPTTSVLSKSDILESQLSSVPVIMSERAESFAGGDINDVLTKAVNFVKDGVELAKESAPYIMPLFGMGASSAGSLTGGKKRGKKGGELIGRDELRQQSNNYAEY